MPKWRGSLFILSVFGCKEQLKLLLKIKGESKVCLPHAYGYVCSAQ